VLHGPWKIDVLDCDHRLTQTHRVSDPQLDGSLNPLATGEKRSVGRSQVLEDDLPAAESHFCMPPRNLGIQQSDVADISTDDDRFFVEGFGFGGPPRVLNVQGVQRHRGS
jgi:hypothetical protein